MKITLITACRNSAGTIRTAMESVLRQKGVDVEYIVVDGASTDESVSVFKEYAPRFNGRMRWISEPDRGMYDAINKGIAMATGDVVGILNADDVLATDETLAHIAFAFESPEVGSLKSEVDCVYADIRFVKRRDVASPSQIGGVASPCQESLESLRSAPTVRYCSARRWRPWMFRFAAIVPHPSFYVRRECFERLGGYSLDYRICADFELELRYLYLAKLKAAYLPECVVVMRMGGASTASWRSNVEINREDLRALRANGVWSCLPLIYLKYLFKIWGFVFRKR
ncbi:MAG: glycosyltransferase [Kiritimatiellae bacterium]|nr:glycosyltransferase [Kiritimatiellia bacterium]MBQ6339094.1 glycosyltransferase [Kiritimatiellia bacterium]